MVSFKMLVLFEAVFWLLCVRKAVGGLIAHAISHFRATSPLVVSTFVFPNQMFMVGALARVTKV